MSMEDWTVREIRNTLDVDIANKTPCVAWLRIAVEELCNRVAPWTCPECGPHIKVDEDGCCVMCGAAAEKRGPLNG